MFPILFETIQRESAITFPMFGNWTINPPSFFTVFGKDIYFYGVLIACGFLLGILYCSKKSASFGIKEDDVYDLMIWLIPLSIVGARLYFVLFRLDDFIGRPFVDWIAIWEGGLAIYGGVIAGILVIILFCRKKKISIPAMLDLIVFGLLIGQIIGRWGNFMNREAFGGETDVFCRMGLISPNGETIYVHPTFLYESLWNLVGLLLILLVICAAATALSDNLLVSVIIYMSFSLLMSIVWIFMESPDLAITEAAVGAGITGLLMILALKKIHAIDARNELKKKKDKNGEDETHE